MRKLIPKSVLSGLILLLMSCSAMAATYKLVFPIEELKPKTWTATSAVTSDWAVSGSPYSCGAWSPNPLTVYEGEAFEQTRTCSRDYERSQALRESELSSGEIRIASTSTQTKTDTITQSQYNIGMLDPWLTTTSTYTGWANLGAPNYSLWSPSPSTQTVNFNQTRNYTQNQERYEQKREQNDLTNVYRNIGTPIRHTQVISGTETRTVAVAASSWANSAAVYACSVWSPGASTQTSSYTQSRSCSQDQNRTWTYQAGTTAPHTRQEYQTVTRNQSRTIAVTVSGWSNSGSAYNCGSWSPATSTVKQGQSFQQNRYCTQKEVRTWPHKSGTTTIYNRNEYRTNWYSKQSRNAVGTMAPYVWNYIGVSPYMGGSTPSDFPGEAYYEYEFDIYNGVSCSTLGREVTILVDGGVMVAKPIPLIFRCIN